MEPAGDGALRLAFEALKEKLAGEGLFAARSFHVHADDVVLVTESPLPATAGILGVFNATAVLASRIEG